MMHEAGSGMREGGRGCSGEGLFWGRERERKGGEEAREHAQGIDERRRDRRGRGSMFKWGKWGKWGGGGQCHLKYGEGDGV